MPIWIGIMIHQWMGLWVFFFRFQLGFPKISRQNPSADDSTTVTTDLSGRRSEGDEGQRIDLAQPGGDW